MKLKIGRFPLATLIAISLMATLAGCFDPCRKIACDRERGQCVEGKCECRPGYEGDDCTIPVNQKVDGTYSLSERCWPSGDDTYEITVTPVEGTVDQFDYVGLWNVPTVSVRCTILEDGRTFTFDTIQLPVNGGTRNANCASGIISEDGSEIDLIYRIYLPNATVHDDSCTSQLVRQ